jgi:flagellar basal body rod protein FlgG
VDTKSPSLKKEKTLGVLFIFSGMTGEKMVGGRQVLPPPRAAECGCAGKTCKIKVWHPHCFQAPLRMDVSLYQAAAGMNASSRWEEIIAQNLESSQVPGFKRQDVSFSGIQSGFLARGSSTLSGPAQRFQMPLAGSSTNFQSGELRPTGVSTDLAIEGTGFFDVQMPDGTHGYTRDGGFRVDAQGQLVNKQGLPVMGEGGPIQLDARNTSPIIVAINGEISQDGVVHGRLKIADFSDPKALVSAGGGCFVVADPAIQPKTPATVAVHQGYLENSNTSTVQEMGNMITAMRFYEANQKVAQMEDDRINRLISDVASPS